MYVVQLLPDEQEARLLRKVLTSAIQSGELTDAEEDMAWIFVSKICHGLLTKDK